jgi:CheY-like chemotaxis protein
MVKLHVLFADQDSCVGETIGRALEHDPFFVACGCKSGREVLKAAIAWRPDLALVALGTPGLDGPAVLRSLRADARTAAIRVVFVTEPAQAGEGARLKAMGAAGVIAKPLAAEGLPAELRGFIPAEGALAAVRQRFLVRLDADAGVLWAMRRLLVGPDCGPALVRINRIAHALAGAAGIYGFGGVTSVSAALSSIVEDRIAGRARTIDVEHALDRVLERIGPIERLSAA